MFLPLLLGACGGTDHRPYPYFDRVEVVAASPGVGMPSAQSGSEIAGKVPEETAVGVALGTGTGLALSLICGPAFTECAGVIVPLLAGPNLVSAPVGAGLAIITGMSREEADQVIAYFEALPKRRDLNQELVVTVADMLPKERITTTGGDARLSLGIRDIQIYQNLNNTFAFHITIEANLEWAQTNKQTDLTRRNYNCYTQDLPVDSWLADGGHSLDEAITLCIDETAQLVSVAIMKKPKTART